MTAANQLPMSSVLSFAYKLKKFGQLSSYEQLVVVQSFALLLLLAGCLKVFGLQKTQDYLVKVSPTVSSIEPSNERLKKAQIIARLVDRVAARLFPVGNCLKKSLTLWFMLRKQGIESQLRIGVRRDNDDQIQAHAWVECGEIILNDIKTVHSHYAVFEECFEGSI